MLRSFFWQPVAMASALILNSMLCFGAVSPDTKPHSDKSSSTLQVARYSVMTPQASEAQQDLLAMARPLDIPQDILTVGEALNWLLVPSCLLYPSDSDDDLLCGDCGSCAHVKK